MKAGYLLSYSSCYTTSSCGQTELSVDYNKERWDVTPFLLNEEITSVCTATMQTLTQQFNYSFADFSRNNHSAPNKMKFM